MIKSPLSHPSLYYQLISLTIRGCVANYSNYFNSTKPSTARSAGGFKTVKEETKVKKILRDIKKPVVVPEIPKQKYKMNFSGKYSAQNTPDKTASKLSDDLVASGNARGQRWRAEDKYWQGYETTERMNIIFDRVGHGDQYWDEIVNENMRKYKMAGLR